MAGQTTETKTNAVVTSSKQTSPNSLNAPQAASQSVAPETTVFLDNAAAAINKFYRWQKEVSLGTANGKEINDKLDVLAKSLATKAAELKPPVHVDIVPGEGMESLMRLSSGLQERGIILMPRVVPGANQDYVSVLLALPAKKDQVDAADLSLKDYKFSGKVPLVFVDTPIVPSWRYANNATRDVDELGSNFQNDPNKEPIVLIFRGNHAPGLLRSKATENNLELTIKNESADYLFYKAAGRKIGPDQVVDFQDIGYKASAVEISETYSDLVTVRNQPLTQFTQRMRLADNPVEGSSYGLADAILVHNAKAYASTNYLPTGVKNEVAAGKLTRFSMYLEANPDKAETYRKNSEAMMDDFVSSVLNSLK